MQPKPARMQELNWQDLRYLLAVARAGTLAAAARLMRVDETTVGRRLAAAERALGATLFARGPGGGLQPTPAGESALRGADAAERAIEDLAVAVSGSDAAVAGTVRLTAVPVVANRLLTPALPALFAAHPRLRLELIAEPRDLSLTRRDADLALRLARPAAEAGAGMLSRRVGRLRYAVYGPAGLTPAEACALPWITYDDRMAGLPQARWIAAVAGERLAPVAVNDAEGVLQAVRAGLGRSLLPRAVADREPGLQHLAPPAGPPLPERELWLLAHPDQRRLARVAAVVGWIGRWAGALDGDTDHRGHDAIPECDLR